MKPIPSLPAGTWPVLLVLAVIVLLPVGRTSELPLVLAAIGGLVLLVRGRIDLATPAPRLALVLFACYWLPALLSAPDAVEPARSWSTVGVTLRFLPFALFAGWALRDATRWPALVAAIAAVVLLWCIDAYVQMATGHSLGGAAEAERVSGIFGAGNLKLGPVLAVLSPFVLVAAGARFGLRGVLIALLLMAAPVLLAGSRAAWLSFLLAAGVMLWQATRSRRQFAGLLVVFALAVGALGALAWHDSERFGARIERSLLALHGTEGAIDQAAAGRLRIWQTALTMAASHPFNGVGVRGFRYAYPAYAEAGDDFVDPRRGTGAAHAHQIVLEVASETGAVGLACWLAGVVLAWRAWRRADTAARARALAPGVALLAMTIPLNTHLAFYSAWWGLLFWWLLALYCAALGAGGPRPAVRSE